VGHDVTECKRARDALAQSEERYRAVVERESSRTRQPGLPVGGDQAERSPLPMRGNGAVEKITSTGTSKYSEKRSAR